MKHRHLLVGFVGLVSLVFPHAASRGQAKKAAKVDWALVLKVDGKEVKVEIRGAGFDVVPEDDSADTFAITGVGTNLDGRVDVNGDGTIDGKDKLALDEKGEVKLAAAMDKKVILDPTEEKPGVMQNSVQLPEHGRCGIVKGSTLTVTKFRKAGKSGHVIFSGTADLKLKTQKGRQISVQGRWEAGTGVD